MSEPTQEHIHNICQACRDERQQRDALKAELAVAIENYRNEKANLALMAEAWKDDRLMLRAAEARVGQLDEKWKDATDFIRDIASSVGLSLQENANLPELVLIVIGQIEEGKLASERLAQVERERDISVKLEMQCMNAKDDLYAYVSKLEGALREKLRLLWHPIPVQPEHCDDCALLAPANREASK